MKFLEGVSFLINVPEGMDKEWVLSNHNYERFVEYYPEVVRSVLFWYAPPLDLYKSVNLHLTDLVHLLDKLFWDKTKLLHPKSYGLVLRFYGEVLGVEERVSPKRDEPAIAFTVRFLLPEFCDEEDEEVLVYFWGDKSFMSDLLESTTVKNCVGLTLDHLFNESFCPLSLWLVLERKYSSGSISSDIRFDLFI